MNNPQIDQHKLTRGTVVAIDIVGYSNLIKNGELLTKARQRLMEAVLGDAFFSNKRDDHMVAHYLGDEFRLGFDSSVNFEDVARFVHNVIRALSNDGDSPDVRAVTVQGLFAWGRLETAGHKCHSQYIYGPAVDLLPPLLDMGGHEMKLVSKTMFRESEPFQYNNEGHWCSKGFGKLKETMVSMPVSRDIEGRHCYVVAITHGKGILAGRKFEIDSDAAFQDSITAKMIGMVRDSIEGLGSDLRLSVGPSAMLVAIPDKDFTATSAFLHKLKGRIEINDKYKELCPVVGVARGHLNFVEDHPWLGLIFEGKPAVVASRIASGIAKKGAWEIAFCKDCAGDIQGIIETNEDDEVQGKRDESFPVRKSRSWLNATNPASQNAILKEPASPQHPTMSSSEPAPTTPEAWSREFREKLEDLDKEMRGKLNHTPLGLDRSFPLCFLDNEWEKAKNLLVATLTSQRVEQGTAKRRETAKRAIECATRSISAFSVLKSDKWIFEQRYLEANIRRKKELRDDLRIRRVLIGDLTSGSSQDSKAKVDGAIQKQRDAGIEILVVSEKEFLEAAGSVDDEKWAIVRNLLIVDDKFMTWSNPRSPDNGGESVLQRQLITDAISCFEIVWDTLYPEE